MQYDTPGKEEFAEQIAAELKVINEANEPQEEVKQERVFSDEEQEAMKNGWDPNFEGPNKVSAYEFNRFGRVMNTVREQQNEINSLKQTVKESIKHSREMERIARVNKLAEADTKRRAAASIGDMEEFEAQEREVAKISQEITDIDKEVLPLEEPKPVESPKTQIEIDFENRNKDWFNTDTAENTEMAEEAYAYGIGLVDQVRRQNKNYTPEQIISKIEDRIRRLYPHRFENQKKERPAMVGKSTASDSEVVESLSSKLSERQLKFWREQNRIDPSFTKEEYAKQLKAYGALE